MPDDRLPNEPTYKELQQRIREWLKLRWRQTEAGGRSKTDLARQLGLRKQTVGAILNDNELPGLECFMRMHWRLQLEPYRMMHEDAWKSPEAAELRARTSAQFAAQDQRRRQKVSQVARK